MPKITFLPNEDICPDGATIDVPVGTSILVPGFSPAGPVDEVLQVASLSEFEQIYGLPTNAAERYFYHTVKSTFQSQANVYVSRLAYGEGGGTTVSEGHYSAIVYPVKAFSTTVSGHDGNLDSSGIDEYKLGTPEHIELDQETYEKVINRDFTFALDIPGSILIKSNINSAGE